MIRHDQILEDKVIGLIRQIEQAKKSPIIIQPTADEEIRKFENLHNLILPMEVKKWLQKCNGASVGPGGLYSLFSKTDDDCSINWYFEEYPEWKQNGWLPISDDGCGNIYLVAMSLIIPSTQTHPAFFLDQADDTPSYIVASGLWTFLFFLLENEILHCKGDESYWPFDKAMVLAVDPHIIECKQIPLPWDT
jgi:hypothetical protein